MSFGQGSKGGVEIPIACQVEELLSGLLDFSQCGGKKRNSTKSINC